MELALADLQGSRGDKDHVQLPSVHAQAIPCALGRSRTLCVSSQDVLKAAWEGISVPTHFSGPIFLPHSRSQQPEGVSPAKSSPQ